MPALVRGRAFADVIDDLRWTNFLLAYQGEDDRALQERYARSWRARSTPRPEWRAAAAPLDTGDRIRVGFASAFFRDGTAAAISAAGSPGSTARGSRSSSTTSGATRRRSCRRSRRTSIASARSRAPHSLPSAIAADDSRRRARRARLPGARHGRDVVRARRVAPRAAPVRRLGTSGHDGARDDRRVFHLRGDGARGRGGHYTER